MEVVQAPAVNGEVAMKEYGYVEDCKVKYLKCVLSGAREHPGDQDLLRSGIGALLELSKKRGRDAFVEIEDIYEVSKINPAQSITAGLWAWLDGFGSEPSLVFGAGIVEKAGGRSAYRIRKEFYRAVEQAFSEYAQ
jgi:hypothetical protein